MVLACDVLPASSMRTCALAWTCSKTGTGGGGSVVYLSPALPPADCAHCPWFSTTTHSGPRDGPDYCKLRADVIAGIVVVCLLAMVMGVHKESALSLGLRYSLRMCRCVRDGK